MPNAKHPRYINLSDYAFCIAAHFYQIPGEDKKWTLHTIFIIFIPFSPYTSWKINGLEPQSHGGFNVQMIFPLQMLGDF